MRASTWLSAALDGVNAASLALMAAVSLRLALPSLPDVLSLILFACSLLLMLRWKINSFWLILAGGLMGVLSKILF